MIGVLVVLCAVALEVALSSLAARWLRRRVASLERRLDHAEAALCALRILCGGVFVWGLLCLGGAR